MEHYSLFRYTGGYETPRDPATTGATTPTGHPVVKSRETPVGGGSCLKRLQELGLSVVRGVQKEGTHGASPQTDPRPAAQVIRKSETAADEASSGRSLGLRPSDRPVDLEADRPVDPQAVSHSVPPQPCLAVTSRHGVELSETGAPGSATGRRGDRPLEAVPLAAYKKTPSDVAPIWSSSMNPVSCSSPTWPAPGRPKGKRLSFTIATNRTASRRSAPWRCPPNEGGWRSIFSFAPAISQAWMFKRSLRICSGISGDRWFCSGIAEPFIVAGRLSSGSKTIPDSRWSRSRRTRPSSIRRSISGARRIGRWPTVRQRTWSNLPDDSRTRSDESGDRKNSCGPVSTLPIYHGPDKGVVPLLTRYSIAQTSMK